MAKKNESDKVQSRDRGNYVSVEQDEDSGLYYGVVTSSIGEDVPEAVIYTSTSKFGSEEDARANAEAWCRDRGYQFTSV